MDQELLTIIATQHKPREHRSSKCTQARTVEQTRVIQGGRSPAKSSETIIRTFSHHSSLSTGTARLHSESKVSVAVFPHVSLRDFNAAWALDTCAHRMCMTSYPTPTEPSDPRLLRVTDCGDNCAHVFFSEISPLAA